MTEEQVWLFFHQFQLDLEAGLATAAGREAPYGYVDPYSIEPQIMLQWSDDGGKTWSEEVWVSAGRMGQYKHRAIWRRLGRGRTRTWRVVVTEPIAWRLLDAYVQAEKGTS